MALTPVQALYDAFFVLIESDEWDTWEETAINNDLEQVAKAAVPWFKFPRCSLGWNEEGDFTDSEISNIEIQILAQFMKSVWLSRVVDSWENLRPFYTERDFSPAKMLGEFRQKQESQWKAAKDLERLYYRSVKGKPFDYTGLAGGK